MKRDFVTIDDPRWVQCHASTVAVVAGEPVVAWFAGSREGSPDNRIVVWRGGTAEVLDTGLAAPHWNPVLAPAPDGSLALFFKLGWRISRWVTFLTRSTDGGATWSPARELAYGDTSGGRGPVKNPPLLTPDGLWLAPGSVEDGGERATWDPFVDVSADGGTTWERSPIPVDHARLAGAGPIQPALWWGRTGPVALMRSSEGCAYRSTAPDGGRTWTPAVPTALPNNNSGLAAIALPSGRVVCVHNPSGQNWGSRCPLTVSVSDDDGLTWRSAFVLDDGEAPVDPDVPRLLDPAAQPGIDPSDAGVVTGGVAEYSYPSAVLDGSDLLISYTWQRRGIVLARVPIGDL